MEEKDAFVNLDVQAFDTKLTAITAAAQPETSAQPEVSTEPETSAQPETSAPAAGN